MPHIFIGFNSLPTPFIIISKNNNCNKLYSLGTFQKKKKITKHKAIKQAKDITKNTKIEKKPNTERIQHKRSASKISSKTDTLYSKAYLRYL